MTFIVFSQRTFLGVCKINKTWENITTLIFVFFILIIYLSNCVRLIFQWKYRKWIIRIANKITWSHQPYIRYTLFLSRNNFKFLNVCHLNFLSITCCVCNITELALQSPQRFYKLSFSFHFFYSLIKGNRVEFICRRIHIN